MKFATLLAALLVCLPAIADIKPAAIIGDGMVLQQGVKAPIWGTAAEGEKVVVEFTGQKLETVAQGGKWRVDLAPLKAGGPWPMTIQGANKLALAEVYVGEVWVCSGQSNMDYQVKQTKESAEAAKTGSPMLRLNALKGGWTDSDATTIPTFTAVGFVFGQRLCQELKVPVGLIWRSVGGTAAQLWTPPEALKEIQIQGNGQLYLSLIKPLQPFAIRGAIWYQGESNAFKLADAVEYERLFAGMIKGWRKDWNQGDFPFLFIQLPRIGGPSPAAQFDHPWAVLRESQTRTLALPNTGMAVTYDVSDGDLHPRNKMPMAQRLAAVALAKVYGQKVPFSGPMFKTFKREGDRLVISFDHAEGLAAKDAADGAVKDIFQCGDDGKVQPASAKVEGQTVVVDLKGASPQSLLYAWSSHPAGNLFNAAGLPAGPFRVTLKEGPTSAPAPAK